MYLAAGDAPYVSPIARWVAVACVVLMLGAVVYAFVTRYRRDWDALLRDWSTRPRAERHADGAPRDESPRWSGPDRWAQSAAIRTIFVGGLLVVVLSFGLALGFHSAGWVVLGTVGALMEGGAALAVGLNK